MHMKQIVPQAPNEAADFNEQRLWAHTGENPVKSSVKRPDKHEQVQVWELDMLSFTCMWKHTNTLDFKPARNYF